MENNELKTILTTQQEVRKEVKFNNFLNRNEGHQLNRVCGEMGLSGDFMKEYTYNAKDKTELIGYILASVKGTDIVKEVVKNAKETSEETLSVPEVEEETIEEVEETEE